MAFPPKSKPKAAPGGSRPPQQRKPAAAPQRPPARAAAPNGAQPPMLPPMAAPAPLPGAYGGGESLPSMAAMDPAMLAAGAAAPPMAPTGAGTPPMAPPTPGQLQAAATVQSGTIAAAEAKDTPRAEIPQATRAQVSDWWAQTENLPQRQNALWEYREANKTLFPARFDVNDRNRGRTPIELEDGKGKRRVRIARIYRDSLQTSALTVPDDLDWRWGPSPQATPPEQLTGVPQTMALDPVTPVFGKTLTIVQRMLLDEASFLKKAKAWVQDASLFPIAVLKFCFRREFATTYLGSTQPDRDTTDAMARLEALVQQYAMKEFDDNDARFATMLDLVKSLQANARLTRWFGHEITLLSMDQFGISEDARDLVDIYDAQYMFEDCLVTGEQLLTRFPYGPTPDDRGNTFGVREDELGKATPWDTENPSTDPLGKNTTRGRGASVPKPSGLSAMSKTRSMDPKRSKYLVRTVWSKKDRTVYTMLKGLDHYLEVHIPQKTSERWYPFAVLAPNRVPAEVYGIADLELKREIQARINRKRSDEEKARWLSLDRLIYNTQMIDSKEIVKISDIPPGQARGINLGSSSVKITDAIMTFAYQFKPEAFDTAKDERDMDMMGALPIQALGQTGTANYAAEVEVAAQGAAAAVKQRQAIVRYELEGLLHASAQVLLQELTPEEAQKIAGPFAVWPVLYDEAEAAKIIDAAKAAAQQQVAPQVMAGVVQSTMSGLPIDPKAIQAQLEQAAAPLWQGTIVNQYGSTEPLTRDSIYRRMKVSVTSTLQSTLDRQSRIQSVSLLAQAVLGMSQAALASGTPFNPRALLKKGAELLEVTDDFDEMFPAVSPLDLAAAQAGGPTGAPGTGGVEPGGQPADGDEAAAPGGGPPTAQGAQAKQGTSAQKSKGATAQHSPAVAA